MANVLELDREQSQSFAKHMTEERKPTEALLAGKRLLEDLCGNRGGQLLPNQESKNRWVG